MSRFNVTDDGRVLTKRFFHTLEVLKQKRVIRGLKTFTDLHNLNYWNMHTIQKEQNNHAIKAEWLSYLVQDYNISAEYLLTGIGSMFKDENLEIASS